MRIEQIKVKAGRRPQDWKRHFGLLRAEKDASRTVASHRVPSGAADLALKRYHNRADALLIGLYGMTKEAAHAPL